MKIAPSEYSELYRRVTEHIGADRSPTIIGFDGEGSAGKTSAANWLAWQLGIPALHLDLYLLPSVVPAPIEWDIEALERVVRTRGADRCLIVEGVLLLDALKKIRSRELGYLVFVENLLYRSNYRVDPERRVIDQRRYSLDNQIEQYFSREDPKSAANFILSWKEPGNLSSED